MPVKISQRRFRVSTAYWPRREFNPADPADLAEYRHFLQKQKPLLYLKFLLQTGHLSNENIISDPEIYQPHL